MGFALSKSNTGKEFILVIKRYFSRFINLEHIAVHSKVNTYLKDHNDKESQKKTHTHTHFVTNTM